VFDAWPDRPLDLWRRSGVCQLAHAPLPPRARRTLNQPRAATRLGRPLRRGAAAALPDTCARLLHPRRNAAGWLAPAPAHGFATTPSTHARPCPFNAAATPHPWGHPRPRLSRNPPTAGSGLARARAWGRWAFWPPGFLPPCPIITPMEDARDTQTAGHPAPALYHICPACEYRLCKQSHLSGARRPPRACAGSGDTRLPGRGGHSVPGRRLEAAGAGARSALSKPMRVHIRKGGAASRSGGGGSPVIPVAAAHMVNGGSTHGVRRRSPLQSSVCLAHINALQAPNRRNLASGFEKAIHTVSPRAWAGPGCAPARRSCWPWRWLSAAAAQVRPRAARVIWRPPASGAL
jgi:hypothetical protein